MRIIDIKKVYSLPRDRNWELHPAGKNRPHILKWFQSFHRRTENKGDPSPIKLNKKGTIENKCSQSCFPEASDKHRKEVEGPLVKRRPKLRQQDSGRGHNFDKQQDSGRGHNFDNCSNKRYLWATNYPEGDSAPWNTAGKWKRVRPETPSTANFIR